MTVHVNVRNLSGSVISFKSKDTLPLEALKSLALASEAEAVPVGQQVLILGGDGRQIVGDQLNLKEHGIKDGETVSFHLIPSMEGDKVESTMLGLAEEDSRRILDQLLKNPEDLVLLQKTNPPMASAFMAGDFEKCSELVQEILMDVYKERDKALAKVMQQNEKFGFAGNGSQKESNFYAKESSPSFEKFCEAGLPSMLFVPVKMNRLPVKAHVDPGIPITTMSKACANRLRILTLMDPVWGLGTSSPSKGNYGSKAATSSSPPRVVGKIRNFNIEICGKFLNATFNVAETQKWDLILGLDILKEYGCIIDLKRNVMRLESGKVEVPFILEPSSKFFGGGTTTGTTPFRNSPPTTTTGKPKP